MAPAVNIPAGPALPPNPAPPGGLETPLPSPSRTGKAAFTPPGTDIKAETWFSVYGELSASSIPLICLHGGPGMAHNYILPISHLSSPSNPSGYSTPVILYDQLGCGNSTLLPERKGDAAFWTPELFCVELLNLLDHLKIEKYDLLGQSWGGMLAANFASNHQPKGLRRLIIANSPSSMRTWVEVANLLRERLPEDVQETLTRLEKEKKTETEEYEAAVEVFYDRFVCRVKPWPEEFMQTLTQLKNDDTVYLTMNGPSEFHITGSLANWDFTSSLSRINVDAVLLMNGRFDEAQDVTMEPYFREIPGKVKWVRFAESSHCPHLEETHAYLQALGDFLGAA